MLFLIIGHGKGRTLIKIFVLKFFVIHAYWLFTYLPTYLSIYLPTYLPSIYLPTHLPTPTYLYLPIPTYSTYHVPIKHKI